MLDDVLDDDADLAGALKMGEQRILPPGEGDDHRIDLHHGDAQFRIGPRQGHRTRTRTKARHQHMACGPGRCRQQPAQLIDRFGDRPRLDQDAVDRHRRFEPRRTVAGRVAA
jgi:hypothetical protein